jgi:hypothetical protein
MHGFIKKTRRRPGVIWTSPECAKQRRNSLERRRSHEHTAQSSHWVIL